MYRDRQETPNISENKYNRHHVVVDRAEELFHLHLHPVCLPPQQEVKTVPRPKTNKQTGERERERGWGFGVDGRG